MGLPWMLLPDAALFGAVAVGYLLALANTQQTMKSCPDTKVTSHGDAHRRSFQLVLLVANAARCAALLGEVALFRRDLCPQHWVCTVTRTSPTLLFLSSYSALVFYFYELAYEVEGVPTPWASPAFRIVNGVLYFVYALATLLGASGAFASDTQLDVAVYSILGGAYIATFASLMYYAARVASTLRPSIMASPSPLRALEPLRRRPIQKERSLMPLILAISGLLGLILALSALYCIAVAARAFGWRDGYPPETSMIVFDATFYALLELLPAILVLVLTRRRRSGVATPSEPQSPAPATLPHGVRQEYPEADSGAWRGRGERVPLLPAGSTGSYGGIVEGVGMSQARRTPPAVAPAATVAGSQGVGRAPMAPAYYATATTSMAANDSRVVEPAAQRVHNAFMMPV